MIGRLQQTFAVQDLVGHAVGADLKGENLSPDAAALLWREIDRRTCLFDQIHRLYRDARLIERTFPEPLAQHIFGMAMGAKISAIP